MISSESLFSFKLEYKNVCQLEGSDHGGRDSAAELALAGIDVQTSDGSCNRLTLGQPPPTRRIIHLRNKQSTPLCKGHH